MLVWIHDKKTELSVRQRHRSSLITIAFSTKWLPLTNQLPAQETEQLGSYGRMYTHMQAAILHSDNDETSIYRDLNSDDMQEYIEAEFVSKFKPCILHEAKDTDQFKYWKISKRHIRTSHIRFRSYSLRIYLLHRFHMRATFQCGWCTC